MIKEKNSGQTLIVAVLIIALLLISTELYVYEFETTVDDSNPNSFSDSIFAIRLGSQHVVISSLANISRGGLTSVLTTNLEDWASFIEEQRQLGKFILDFSTGETLPYHSGIWISWGADGVATTGAYVNLTLKLSDRDLDINTKHIINVTSTVQILGTYRVIQGGHKHINVTCNVLNEGKPALAKNTILYYRNDTSWLPTTAQNNYSITNYGNGTYSMTFEANITSSDVDVSLHVYDQRGIHALANVTCTEA
ncbi:MAG: hypothetical protein JSV58_02490 [Candidatus Bathyarchaeota archaeon]|nr:MAG: hypothetical protein JSV58_02490 [Candidatus Bathyarchaeota archaeon]